MTRTVDIVIAGADQAAIAAAIEAVRNGLRVLVVMRSTRASLVRRLRQELRSASVQSKGTLLIQTGAEVACADGVNAIEAVVVRDLRTGRLSAFNASALHDHASGVSAFRTSCRLASMASRSLGVRDSSR